MINLILTMLVAYNDYGTALKFDKSDINNLIKEHNVSFDNIDRYINELGWIILWENKLISDEYFCKLMNIEIINGNTYLVIDNFDDILSKDYEFEINILDSEYDYEPSFYDGYDIDNWWRDYTEDTKKEIINFCVNKGLEIDGELMDEENTILKNGEIYFNDEKLVDYINDDDLSDLNSVLQTALSEAQDSADQNEFYRKILNAFEDKIGTIEHKSKTILKDGKETTREMIHIKLNISWDDVKSELSGFYGDFEFEQTNYGDLTYILKEIEYFNFSKPNYDYISGSIDDDVLNDYTIDRLRYD